MKRALVCGAGGFIGHHLVRRLKAEGYWVRGVDLKPPEFSITEADEFLMYDLRAVTQANAALGLVGEPFDEVYQLAADMGGMGFIASHEVQCLRHNALINLNVIHAANAQRVGRYFFSSSVCVYPDMKVGAEPLTEDDAYPAQPDNEYGWEKLYAERVVMAYAKRGLNVRVARFQNCYGPEGTWRGGREKAPAAFCRKVAEDEHVEVWGDGSAVRNYIYIDDLLDAMRLLMRSGDLRPTNIGTDEYVTVDELAGAVADAAGKPVVLDHVDGPVGVASRNFSNERMKALGWEPMHTLTQGIAKTYPWVAEQVAKAGLGVTAG